MFTSTERDLSSACDDRRALNAPFVNRPQAKLRGPSLAGLESWRLTSWRTLP